MMHGAQMVDLQNNYYVIRFRDKKDAQVVLTGGPWGVLGHYLNVPPWEYGFSSKMNKIISMVVWARILDIPLYFYNRRVLKAMGSLLGTVVSLDYQTDEVSRGKYARIAMQLDLTKPIQVKVRVEGVSYVVAHENVSLICYRCGYFEHFQNDCQSNDGHLNAHQEGAPEHGGAAHQPQRHGEVNEYGP